MTLIEIQGAGRVALRVAVIVLALMAQLVGASLARAQDAAQAPVRSDHDRFALDRWISLPHDRQLLVLQSLGVAVPQDFFNCVCRAAGYGSPGTSQIYHPDTIGTYDERYSCQHPGPPCVVSGFGCTRHDMPSNPALFESCAAATGLAGGNPMDNILTALKDRGSRNPISGNPVVMNPDAVDDRPPPDCARSRGEAGLPLRPEDEPVANPIYALSAEAMVKLEELKANPELYRRTMETLQAILARLNDIDAIADERDLRVDLDIAEVGFSVTADRRIQISEIVFKPYEREVIPDTLAINPEFAFNFGKAADGEEGTIAGHDFKGFKFGFSFEGKGEMLGGKEAKYGIEMNTNVSARDYYDGEWQKESEYRLIRSIENFVSMLDFYAGGAVNIADAPFVDGGEINVGREYTWKLKDRYSNWLFADMHEALDSLLENQKEWEDQRHDYIDREARRFGIDARCFSAGTTISLVHAAYEKAKATDPAIQPPFVTISDRIRARQAVAQMPSEPAPAPAPVAPARPAPPETGIYREYHPY